ncbi:membrane protein [Longimycelium tulufanense]|uniref:Membrane protein n=1 Tax=Longimycelium tulufanense TaxID=907463 RepID=A0A8J3CAN9_9PSEU|nr:type II CAAX endopeptidase family protein [Longimycelium tulufanense]GGM39856.1 membrane protein [Longimycelium tulufanense]
MREVAEGHDPRLHERYWEAQLTAATRGALHWGFLAFFLGYGGFYLANLILTVALSRHVAAFDPVDPPQPGPILLVTFIPNALLGLAPAILSWTRGQGLRRDFGIIPTWRDLRIGLACGAISLGGALLFGLFLDKLPGNHPPPDSGVDGLARLAEGQTLWLALYALLIFLGAPLTEELLMRGALWGALEHYRVPRYAILLLTALIFAFLHEEPFRTPALFFQGIAIGAARMITGRVATSMIAHAVNNFLPALVLFALLG